MPLTIVLKQVNQNETNAGKNKGEIHAKKGGSQRY